MHIVVGVSFFNDFVHLVAKVILKLKFRVFVFMQWVLKNPLRVIQKYVTYEFWVDQIYSF